MQNCFLLYLAVQVKVGQAQLDELLQALPTAHARVEAGQHQRGRLIAAGRQAGRQEGRKAEGRAGRKEGRMKGRKE